VSAELFSRYDSVLLSALLDTMEDVLYCPRPVCQYPVALEPGEKMATCPSCGYAFCIYCKMVYHGIEPCRFRSSEYIFYKFGIYFFLQVYPLLFLSISILSCIRNIKLLLCLIKNHSMKEVIEVDVSSRHSQPQH
jgi:hypothetical protein